MPVRFIAISGYGANHLHLVPLANTPINVVATSEDPNYRATNQINRNAIQPWRPWLAEEGAEGVEVVFDKNQTFNGGFETGDLEGWEIEGTATADAVRFNSGAYSIEMNATEANASARQDVVVRPGEKITVTAAARGNTGTANVSAYIKELGLWLQSGGTFSSTPAVFGTSAPAAESFTVATKTPTVPAYSVNVPDGRYTLTCIAEASGGTANVDDFYVWHWTDTAGMIGQNVHPVVEDVELHASTDNFASNDSTIFTWTPGASSPNTLQWPNTYGIFTQTGQRWWKFLFDGTNDVPLWTGQFFLSQYLALSRNPNYGIVVETVQSQRRNETTGGAEWINTKEDIQRRMFRFPWRYHSTAEWQQALQRIFYSSQFGRWPTLMIHDDTDTESCAFVRPPERFDFTHKFVNVRDSVDFPLRELAFPTFD